MPASSDRDVQPTHDDHSDTGLGTASLSPTRPSEPLVDPLSKYLVDPEEEIESLTKDLLHVRERIIQQESDLRLDRKFVRELEISLLSATSLYMNDAVRVC